MLVLLSPSSAVSACSIARGTDIPDAPAVVRSARYTTKEASGCTIPGVGCSKFMMDPICGSGAGECEELECGAGPGLDVLFNSRSYLLASAGAVDGACQDQNFVGGRSDCVDYDAGAYRLAGKTLSMTLDLSSAECGCNAAIYLVGMPQLDKRGDCDGYCDANSVCGVGCGEIDLVEANKVAFVSTVHVADDSSGEAYGLGHYVTSPQRRLTSLHHTCAYGPRPSCAINTNRPFEASFTFASSGFGYELRLSQEGRTAGLKAPVRYTDKPPGGSVGSATEANQILAAQLAGGMTLVVSYWSGRQRDEMAWLDHPCRHDEQSQWGCTDEWTEHPSDWPWSCDGLPADEPPTCGRFFRVSELRVSSGWTTVAVGGAIVVLLLLAAAAAYWRRELLVPLLRPQLDAVVSKTVAALRKGKGKGGSRRERVGTDDVDDEMALKQQKRKAMPKAKVGAKGSKEIKEREHLRAPEPEDDDDDDDDERVAPPKARKTRSRDRAPLPSGKSRKASGKKVGSP